MTEPATLDDVRALADAIRGEVAKASSARRRLSSTS